MATVEQTPHYLGLLNTIAQDERRASVLLQAWADKTPDPEMRSLLTTFVAREASHYHVFNRRIEELGYTLEDEEAPEYEERLRLIGSDAPDIEKVGFEKARRARRQSPTLRDKYVAAASDETVDPLTRSLLRWFADEEADSASRATEAYERIEAAG